MSSTDSNNNQGAQAQQAQKTVVVDGKSRNVKVCKTCQKEIFWIVNGKKDDGSDKFEPKNLDGSPHEHPKTASSGGGFRKEFRPLVFAFHLPSSPSAPENRKMIENFKKDNPKCYLVRYEVKEDGKGYYIFEEKGAPIGSG